MPETPEARLVYIMGCGRSGSTALAAALGSHPDVLFAGELIHLARSSEPMCSCGKSVTDCEVWSSRGIHEAMTPAMREAHSLETHKAAAQRLLGGAEVTPSYEAMQLDFDSQTRGDSAYVLDSSKYVGRASALAACDSVDVRVIYLVRDPRGVAHSFGKKVQTRRNVFSACWYYILINTLGELSSRRMRERCIKVRYEDLLENPETEFERIGELLELDMSPTITQVQTDSAFAADHVVGGNRWVYGGPRPLRLDVEWKQQLGFLRQAVVYALCLPFQLLNRYRF